MGKLNVAIIGCGMIADSHAIAIGMDGRALVTTAAYGTNVERGAAFAKNYDVPFVCGDYRDIIKNGGIDMACVCTPSGMHAECAVDFLNAGAPVLVEKPLDITGEAMTLMIDAAERNGLPLGCVFPNRTRKGLQRAKQLIDSGEPGEMYFVECQYRGYRSPDYYRASNWKGKLKYDGGGCLINQGIHGVDAMLWLTGPVEAVSAQTGIYGRDIEVENSASALMKFANGAQGVLMGATMSYTPENGPECDRIRIECANGTIVYADGKTTYYKNNTPGSFDVQVIPLDADATEAVSSGSAPENIDIGAHSVIVSDFISAVLEKREPMVPASSARLSVDTILAVYRSATSGRWEKL